VAERALTSILDVLLAEQVSFVLVGALAAVAQGAPLTTQDVDIVHARTPENLDRLLTALSKLNARYRGRAPDSPLPPDRRALATTGHSLLMTDLGPLDCLGAIEEGRDYDALVPLAVEVELEGRQLRVLGLETIVAIKRASQHQKDRAALPVLEATLKQRDQRRS
jgi:predicted nucleotidyltransferase